MTSEQASAGPVTSVEEDSMSYTSPFVPQVLPKALDASCGAYKLREQLQEKIMFRSESGRWSSVREALKVLRLGSAIEGMWITPEELQTTLRDRLGLTVPDGPYLRLLSGARHDKHGRIHFGDFVNAIASADFTRRLWVDESEERTREARRRYQLPTTKLGFYEHTLPKYVIKDVDELQAVLGRTIERKCGSNGIQRLSTKLFPRQNKKSFTRAEFHDAITTKMGFLCDRATSDALFDRFDTDKSGTVGQFEFVRGVLPPDYSSKQWTAYSEEAAVKNLDKKNRSMKAWVAEQPKPFRVLPQTRAVQGGTARTTDGRQSDEDGSRTEGFGDDDSSEPSSGPRRMPRIPVGKVVPSIDVNRGKPIRSPRARPLPEILRDMKLAAEFQTETGSIATLNRFLRHTWNVKPNTPVPRAIGLSRFKRGLPRLNVVEQRDLRVLADKYMDKQKGVIRLAQLIRDLAATKTSNELSESSDWRAASNRAPWSPRRDAAMTDAMRETSNQSEEGTRQGGKRMFPQSTFGLSTDVVKVMSKTYSCRPFSGSSLSSSTPPADGPPETVSSQRSGGDDSGLGARVTSRQPRAPATPSSRTSAGMSPRQRKGVASPRRASRGLAVQGAAASPRGRH